MITNSWLAVTHCTCFYIMHNAYTCKRLSKWMRAMLNRLSSLCKLYTVHWAQSLVWTEFFISFSFFAFCRGFSSFLVSFYSFISSFFRLFFYGALFHFSFRWIMLRSICSAPKNKIDDTTCVSWQVLSTVFHESYLTKNLTDRYYAGE